MSILFEDVSIRTMIGLLPGIIHRNNNRLLDYIDKFYDSSSNSIICSIDNSNGIIKSFKGIFKNLEVDNLITSGINYPINHNSLSLCYKNNDLLDSSIKKEYCHDADSICVKLGDGVTSLLKIFDSSIFKKALDSSLFSNNESNQTLYGIESNNDTILSDPKSFTFDNSMLFSTKVLLKRMDLPLYLYNDLTNGYIYTYYDYNSEIIINDEHTASISGIPGSIIKVKFNDLLKKGFYRIILSRKDEVYLKLSKDELNRLTLKCIENSDEYGSIWEVENYSVRSKDDIMIEKK